MDIEKLIERLRNNNIENNCHDCALGYYAFEAATALSTLQTENEKLRAELEQVKRALAMMWFATRRAHTATKQRPWKRQSACWGRGLSVCRNIWGAARRRSDNGTAD